MNNKAIEILRQHTREFPITGKLLAKKIGLPQRKSGLEGADLRALIHELRVAGFPICASTSGYYFAQNKAELDNFIGRLENRKTTGSGGYLKKNKDGRKTAQDI